MYVVLASQRSVGVVTTNAAAAAAGTMPIQRAVRHTSAASRGRHAKCSSFAPTTPPSVMPAPNTSSHVSG